MLHQNQELPQQDILRSQTSAEENQDNYPVSETINTELMHREPIPKTPFHVISIENKRHFIALGKYKISRECDTQAEALGLADTEPWEIIFNLIVTLQALDKEK